MKVLKIIQTQNLIENFRKFIRIIFNGGNALKN